MIQKDPMDVIAEVSIVKTIENRTYKISIPWAASYEELNMVLREFCAKALEMEESAKLIVQQKADKESGSL